jgi:hypothetical protein
VIWASRKYLAPVFATRLADLGTSTAEPVAVEPPRTSWLDTLGRMITQPGPERAAFVLVRQYFQRDRKLKLRMYPSIGYFLVMTVLLLVRSKGNDRTWADYFQQLPGTQDHLFVLYACLFLVFGAAFEIYFSDEFKAAWIYLAAPLERPGIILLGTFKAIVVGFLLPFFLIVCLPVLYIWKWAALPAIIISLVVSMLVIAVVLIANEKHLPLSLQPSARNQSGNMVRGIMALILLALVGYGHYLVTRLGCWQWLAVPVAGGFTIFLLRKYARLRWQRIRF